MASSNPDEVEQAVDRTVKAVFPSARPVQAYRMRGWRIELPKDVVPAKVGTMDPSAILVLVRRGKSGVTLHIWNPLEFQIIQRHAKMLKASGFEPMVGCIRYTKRGPYPIDPVRLLLEAVRTTMKTATRVP